MRRPAPVAGPLTSFHVGRAPRNKGLRYPPDPPTVDEIIAVMIAASDDPDGLPLRGLIVVLWRAGLRISETLALVETDLDQPRGAILVRRGKAENAARWAWTAGAGIRLEPWLAHRATLPVGPLYCVLRGPTHGRPCPPAGVRARLRSTARASGVRRRFAPHQLRHAHAVEMSREGVPLLVIQRQLGHADLGITSAYLRGIDNTEFIHTVHERPMPMIPATASLTPKR